MKLDELIDLRVPSGVTVSPDGDQVAFEVLHQLSSPTRSLWMMSTSDGDVCRLVDTPHATRLANWSHDGGAVAFLRETDPGSDEFELWVHRTDSSEPRRVGGVEGVIESHAWSRTRDDTHLVAWAERGLDMSPAGFSKSIAGGADDPLVLRGSPDARRRLSVLSPSGATHLSADGLNVWEASWGGPDVIAAIVSRDSHEDAWYSAELCVVDPHADACRVLYRPAHQLQHPVVSPDGSHVAVVEGLTSDRGLLSGAPIVVDVSDGTVRSMADDDIEATTVAWFSPALALFAGWQGTNTVVGTYDLATGERRRSTIRGTFGARYVATISPAACPEIWGVHQSSSAPVEVAVADISTGEVHRVTALNDVIDIDFSTSVQRWSSPDGTEVEGIVYTPGLSCGPGSARRHRARRSFRMLDRALHELLLGRTVAQPRVRGAAAQSPRFLRVRPGVPFGERRRSRRRRL